MNDALTEELRQANARADSYRELLLEAAVTLARARYGKSISPVRVQIGEYIFRVMGNSAEIIATFHR